MFGVIENKQLDNIATWMTAVQQTNLPPILRGVFFMDGNPLPDTCITMYNVEWDTTTQTLFLPVFGPVQWTFHNTIRGWLLLRLVQLSQFTYKIQFDDETLQRGQITPIALGIEIPKWIIDATMLQDENYQNGDIWQRKNIWFSTISGFANYTLRKVVNEDGSYTPAFKDMLNKAPNECLVVARSEK